MVGCMHAVHYHNLTSLYYYCYIQHNIGLVYFAISKKGEKPIDGITDTNPEGLTSVTGKWAGDFAARLHSSDLTCHVLERPEWEIKMV